MNLLSPAISSLARMRSWRIDAWRDNPMNAQRDVLQELVTAAQYTAFGRQYQFSSLFNIRSFKEAVPVHEYEDLKPYIDRIMQGEQNVLWDTPISWFAKSSGTTSDRSKFIPISQESLSNGQYGDLSAVLLQNSPFWGHWLRTPDLSIALMDEWESKIEKLAEATIPENVTSISGVPTWTLVLFRRILEITGKSAMHEVWPNLELYLHGGVSFTPYREQFEQIIGKPIHYLEMYNASEGFFAAQDRPGTDGMLLFPDHGIFMEFMPISEYGKKHPETVGLDKVELGKQYALIISTNGGLWRYIVGDTIQFTQLNPYRIRVSGRLKHYINAFGEEVIVDNSDRAIAEASRITNAIVSDYTAAPLYFSADGNGSHEWIVEFERSPDSLERFTEELDRSLQQLNTDYEAKRHKSIALRMPAVHQARTGLFADWLKGRGKLGGQHKVPRLSNERTLIEELLSMNKA